MLPWLQRRWRTGQLRSIDGGEQTCFKTGREFQTDGAAVLKERLPKEVRLNGTCSSGADDDRNDRVLLRVVMCLLLSRRSWSVYLVRGRPGGRYHVGSGVDRPIARLGVAWPGELECYLAVLPRPNMALQPLIIRSDTGSRPVRKDTSELLTKSCHLIPRILG